MIAPGLLLLALVPKALEAFEVEPVPLAWRELSPGHFDLTRRLPETRRTEGRDLVREMERLVELRFELRDPSGRTLRCFADVVAAGRERSGRARARWLAALARQDPALLGDWGAGMGQLLADDTLRSVDWDPDDDDDADGILTAEAWDLAAEDVAPWNELEVDPSVEQAAIVMFADPASIKAAENDYAAYPLDVASDYEEIYPVAGGHRRGVDPDGRPFATVRLHFRCDLPLWYPDYECDLRILNRVDARGRLRTEIYSRSPDFHWLAGRDVYLPLVTSEGAAVGQLVVRLYGFDLDGVPDDDDDRRVALRASLGNLRLRAERIAARRPAAAPAPATVPEFVVRGAR